MGYLAKRTVKGIAYLYWSTQTHGQRHDEYLGRADDPNAREKAKALIQEERERRDDALNQKLKPFGLTFK